MLYETEKTVLALAITYPDLMDELIGGYRQGMFAFPESQAVYNLLIDIRSGEAVVDWDRVIDMGVDRVKASYIMSLQDKQLLVIPSIGIHSYYQRKIFELKMNLAKKDINRVICNPVFNENEYREILNILDSVESKDDGERSDIRAVLNEYLAWKETANTGIRLGYTTIDYHTGDFSPGEVVAIMGRTATGKTFQALNTIHSMRDRFESIPTAIFSMEMARPTLGERMIQINSNINRHEIGPLHIDELIRAYNYLHVYTKVYSVAEIVEIVKRDGLKVVFIDHLQLMRGEGISLYEKTTRIMQELKTLAKDQNLVMYILVQLSRKAGEGNEAVRLDMARDSGAIEEHSDFIVGIWNLQREEKGEVIERDMRAVRLLKNKRGSTVGIKVHFDPNTGRMIQVMSD